jgi:hypothetical protein
MMNKRGVSTIEIIVSFAIFVAFVVFILLYINPTKQDWTPSLLIDLETGVKQTASVEIMEVPIVVTGAAGGCINISIPQPLRDSSNGNISVLDLDNKNITNGVNLNGNSVQMERTGTFYRIIQSTEIDKNTPLDGCQSVTYTPSVERSELIYSYKKLIAMNNSYYTKDGYTALKQQLNFPLTSDFGIAVSTDTFNITMQKNIPLTQVRVTNYPVQILKDDVKTTGTITLKVW